MSSNELLRGGTFADHDHTNVAARLTEIAARMPDRVAIAVPAGRYRPGTTRPYRTWTFAELDEYSTAVAAGLQQMGVEPGMRIVLLVRFGAEFIALVFALLKAGAVIVLVDPGMGRRNLIKCLVDVHPDGFVAIPAAQAIRSALRHRFPRARFNVTVGARYGVLPRPTLDRLAGTPVAHYRPPPIDLDSPAAIVFTTGSTGPPKGVLYTHRTFNGQIDQVRAHYEIAPGGTDLACFPLFGLFNAVMGTTTVIPDMDPTRPADVDPNRILDAMDQWGVDRSFGSPALWTRVGKHALKVGRTTASLQRVFSAGAPVPATVLQWLRQMMPDDGEIFTPYGATEALPVASIESREVLAETAEQTRRGAGTCVGRKFSGIEWKVIAITDEPIATIDQVRECAVGEVGELMVNGAVVSRQYVTRTDQNALHKVYQGDRVWHRMGDVGYLDEKGRFWFCGRKSHRVQMSDRTLYTEQVEAVLNNHPAVHRTALVGVGKPGSQQAVAVVEPWPEHRPRGAAARADLIEQLSALAKEHQTARHVDRFMIYPRRLPTDIRHNSKIFREQLAPWAARKLGIAEE